MTVAQLASTAGRPPRSVAWLLLLASATAVLLAGLATTAAVLSQLAVTPAALPVGFRFWIWLLAASGLTVASLALRALRWIFLLRRIDTRIPIRDAYIGYLAGLSLLLAPFLLGEIAIRVEQEIARASPTQADSAEQEAEQDENGEPNSDGGAA